jgi:hypothetical protein
MRKKFHKTGAEVKPTKSQYVGKFALQMELRYIYLREIYRTEKQYMGICYTFVGM